MLRISLNISLQSSKAVLRCIKLVCKFDWIKQVVRWEQNQKHSYNWRFLSSVQYYYVGVEIQDFLAPGIKKEFSTDGNSDVCRTNRIQNVGEEKAICGYIVCYYH